MRAPRSCPVVLPALLLCMAANISVATADDARVAAAIGATYGTQRFEQVAISPDGRHVAWVETLTARDGAPDGHSAIYVADAPDGAHRHRVTAGGHGHSASEGTVAWSPDSRQLAFLSDAGHTGQSQIYVAMADGSAAHALTHTSGTLATVSWSPDGRHLTVLRTTGADRELGPLAAGARDTGEIRDAVFEQRLAIVDPRSGALRDLSAPDLYVYEYTWAPDSSHVAVIAARGNGDNNWFRAALYRQDLDGSPLKLIYKPSLQIAVPAYAPDGRHIAFIEGLMSDQGSVGGDVYLVPAAGGAAENLTPAARWSPSDLRWAGDGALVIAGTTGGDTTLIRLDVATRQSAALWRGAETISTGGWTIGAAIAQDGRTSAVIRASFDSPPEVWAGPVGAWHQITHGNDGLHPAWGHSVSLHWKSDGFDVQGWLTYPAHYDATRRYPLVVRVHGGPGDAVTSDWPPAGSVAFSAAAAGYFVLQPNPRGSFGQGEAFTRANVKDFGQGDLRDILAGVDEALRTAPIDPQRLGIYGHSYGGYMTMWAVTQTQRFAAAVAGAGVANWQSYYGQNKIDQWLVPFFGASVYDDPAVYARSSPIQYIKNVRTPTLVIVGERDAECPAPQSFEFWHALKTLGVDTKLVVYADEGHHFQNPAHQKDVVRRALDWFDARLR